MRKIFILLLILFLFWTNDMLGQAFSCPGDQTRKICTPSTAVFYETPTLEEAVSCVVVSGPTLVSGPASGTVLTPGTYEVTWRVTYNCSFVPGGNTTATCSFTITVEQFPLTTFYLDSDGDGRGNPSFVLNFCAPPPTPGPAGFVTDGTDCDDNNDLIWREATLYIDQDGDGFSIGTSNLCYGASPPEGYSETTNGTDCDDNNTAVKAATVWFKDFDNDLRGDGGFVTQCTRPTGYKLASELAALFGDCDDNNSLIWALVTFYIDNDHDGYDAGTTTLCWGLIDPLSLFLAGLSSTTNGSDCDDDNAAVNPTTVWYKDADNDLHSDGTTLTQCTQPTGYRLASELAGTSDCNDNANLVWALVTFYTDNDHDGYDAGSTVSCVGLIPPGSTLTTNGSDCDDNNAAFHSNFSFYADNDDDGYGAGSLIAGICAVNANTPPEGYSANNNDCDDTNDAINPATVWYQDADNDGYSTGFSGTQCLRPPGYKLQSELIAISGDCDDTNAAINPATVWYRDADNDVYSSGATQTQCLRPPGYKLQSELVAIIGDCNDNDPGRNPVVPEVCKNNIDDNCDGIIDDKAICEQCTNGSNLNTTNIASTSARFNWSATANPEQWRIQYKSTKPNAKWVDLPVLTGNIRSVDVSSLAPNQDYSWQIGAKCDGKWTIYSNSVKFKTLALGNKVIDPGNIPTITLNNSTLKLYPNPSRGQFMLDLQVEDKINGTATIQLIDMTGKTVHSQIAAVNQGTLQKSIRISSALSKGIYLVRIIVNDKVYKTQLVYENSDVIIRK